MEKWKKRIGYGIGDLGCNLVFSTMASYLMIFYTDVFGISAAVAGTMMLVTKFIDALTDTGMEILVDKTHTRWGQGRPYFIIGAIPFAIFTIATFYIPDFSMSGKIIWAYVTYCLLCTAYTVVNIPLNTIVPRLTADLHERNCLVSTRMICAMIGTAIVMTITAPLVEFFGSGNQARGYLVTMTIYGIVAMIIFFITFLSTKEVVPSTIQTGKTSVRENFKGLTDQCWLLFIINFLYFALYVMRNTTVLYYFTYNLQKTEWLTLVGLLGTLSGLPMLLVLPALQKRFGKKRVMLLSVAIYIMGDLLIIVGSGSSACLLIGLIVTGLGMYGVFGTTFAMQPDVIDYSEYKKHKNISGTIAAMQGFFVKASMGLASAIVGLILRRGGYVANAVQSQSALASIEAGFIWIPLVLCIAIAASMYFYHMDDIVPEMSQVLNKRRMEMEKETKGNI